MEGAIENGKSYTDAQVMAFLGYNNRTAFFRWARENSIRGLRAGKVWVFPGTHLTEFFEKNATTFAERKAAKDGES